MTLLIMFGNSCGILQGIWSEFHIPALLSNNSYDYWVLQELDDHEIFVKFLQDLITILQKISIKISIRKIDELWIFQGFDQNFFQEMTPEFLWWNYCEFFKDLITILQEIFINISIRKIDELWIFQGFDQNFFQELDDPRILVNFFKDFDRNSGGQLYCLTIQMTIQFFKN